MKILWLNAFTVSVLITPLSLYIYSLNLTIFELLELKAYDFTMSLRGTRSVSGQTVYHVSVLSATPGLGRCFCHADQVERNFVCDFWSI